MEIPNLPVTCHSQILNYLTYSSYNTPLTEDCSPVLPVVREQEIDTVLNITKDSSFSPFNKNHSKEAAKAIGILVSTKNQTDFFLTALLFHTRLPYAMFYYVLTSSLSHHKDFNGAGIPNSFFVTPTDYFPDTSLALIAPKLKDIQRNLIEEFEKGNLILNENVTQRFKAFLQKNNMNISFPKQSHKTLPHNRLSRQEKSKNLTEEQLQKIITISPWVTGYDTDYEHKLWYFREDVPLNSFHWYWHAVNPPFWFARPNIDRRGELFAHVHHQLLLRYNAERMAFNMSKVVPLNNWNETIKEGYFPHLLDGSRNSEYSSRSENIPFRTSESTLNNIIQWTKEINNAIANGEAISDKNETVILDEVKGIDIVSGMVESSSLTPNDDLYGDLHNTGHMIIAKLHDPFSKYNSSFGVMSSTKTALRDPLFYRWHQFVDDFFQNHKMSLRPYNKSELNWKCIHVENFFIYNNNETTRNELNTYFVDRTVDVSRGLDFKLIRESMLVKLQHIDHDDFTYVIKVRNTMKKAINATVRIYMAPSHNEKGEEANDMELYHQFFDMDAFRVRIRPGLRIITRSSRKASITSNPSHIWQNIENEPFVDFRTDEQRLCVCGWPGHLLVPRGTTDGMHFTMLVFITEYEKDKVENPKTYKNSNKCHYGSHFCGVAGGLYPDKRGMGFPFNRKFNFNKRAPYSREFFNRTNMFLTGVTVRHIDKSTDNFSFNI